MDGTRGKTRNLIIDMKKEIAELIVEHSYDMDIREEYSGRGMFGGATTAIVCDNEKYFYEAIGELYMKMIKDAMVEAENYDMKLAQDLLETIVRIRVDNMGYRYIFY